jgi:8-oxo-dGTP pyrophosphatase MutT (NUDIX family)
MATNERSAGFILYRVRPGEGSTLSRVEYLLLDYGKHWDFAKGHVEAGETDHQAAARELAEETGITTVHMVPGFCREMTYFFRHRSRGLIRKTVVFFLAEAEYSTPIKLSREHKAYRFEPIEAALKQVTFATAKQVLREAHKHLVDATSE